MTDRHVPAAAPGAEMAVEQYRFTALFKSNGLSPLPDDELVRGLVALNEHMDVDQIEAYIEKAKRFDQRPMHVTASLPGEYMIDMGNSTVVHWWHLRRDLEALPGFFAAAHCGRLSNQEAVELLHAIVDSCTYDFDGVTKRIEHTTIIMARCAERDPASRFHLDAFRAALRLTTKHGDSEEGLTILKLGVEVGMSVEQSADIIKDIYEGRGIAGYVFHALHDELDALQANCVGGDRIHAVFKGAIRHGHPFKHVTALIDAAATNTPHSHPEIFDRIVAAWEIKTKGRNRPPPNAKPDPGKAFNKARRALFGGELDAPDPKGRPKPDHSYFPEIPSAKLVHGILPYRKTRSFEEGLADLRGIMENHLQEGAYVFDPDTATWYSFGGWSEARRGSVLHEFTAHANPVTTRDAVFVHIHNEGNEVHITPDRATLRYPQLHTKITAFLATMPSGRDFSTLSKLEHMNGDHVPMTGLILTSKGLTEFRVPSNPKVVRDYAETFQEVKRTAMFEFDVEGYVEEHGFFEPTDLYLERMLDALRPRLPDGFEIILHQYDQPLTLGSEMPRPPRGLHNDRTVN